MKWRPRITVAGSIGVALIDSFILGLIHNRIWFFPLAFLAGGAIGFDWGYHEGAVGGLGGLEAQNAKRLERAWSWRNAPLTHKLLQVLFVVAVIVVSVAAIKWIDGHRSSANEMGAGE